MALLGLAAVIALAAAPASAIDPADQAATHAYLQAEYELRRTAAANLQAQRALTLALTKRIGGECAGVLKGAPSGEIEADNQEAPKPSPRQLGERARTSEQNETIEGELAALFSSTLPASDRNALEAFVARTNALSWSDPRVAAAVHQFNSFRTQAVSDAPADVCADMRAWAASGFHVLSQASREFAGRQEALRASIGIGVLSSPDALLKRYEGRSERGLLARTEALEVKIIRAEFDGTTGEQHLDRVLGRPETFLERREHEPVLGRGRTRSGQHYTVRSEPREAGAPGEHCRLRVSVSLEGQPGAGILGALISTENPICVTARSFNRGAPACKGNVTELVRVVAPSVRTVELSVAGGPTITSRVIALRGRHGLVAGLYVQALHLHGSREITLTERDAGGAAVRTDVLEHVPECPEPKRARGPEPNFVELAHATTPTGTPFAINGVFLRFHGQEETDLLVGAGVSGRAEQEEGEGVVGPFGSGKPKTYAWSLALECAPHPFAIVYGFLRAPGATVAARTPGGLVPLTVVPLAAKLHAPGPLVYGVFTAIPSELVVQRADGSTLYTESLVRKAAEEAEFCAGYAER